MEGFYNIYKCDSKKCAKEYVVIPFKSAAGIEEAFKRNRHCPDCGKAVSRVESMSVTIDITDNLSKLTGKVVRRQLEVETEDAVEGDA
jgi:transcription initiation factor IIE alpha subunit